MFLSVIFNDYNIHTLKLNKKNMKKTIKIKKQFCKSLRKKI